MHSNESETPTRTTEPQWWHREWVRQTAATPPAALGLIVPGENLIKLLASWDLYALFYLLFTWLVFRRRTPASLYALGLETRRRQLADRLLGTIAPEKLPIYVAMIALVATIIVLPRLENLGPHPSVVLAICVVAILTCWVVLHASFALVYVGLYAADNGLRFPGGEEPHMSDFIYLATAIGTSYSTPDVTVVSREVRRKITTHSMVSFVFNTLILASAVALVVASVT